MDIYELQDKLKDFYPDKNGKVALDDDCIKCVEVRMDKGKFHPESYVVYGYAKIKIEGESDRLVPIMNHREVRPYAEVRGMLPESPEMQVLPER